MITCQDAERKILENVSDGDLEKHLKHCSACSSFQNDYSAVVAAYADNGNDKPQIPGNMDFAVLAAAKLQIERYRKNRIRLFAIRAVAAVFAVCLVLFLVSIPKTEKQTDDMDRSISVLQPAHADREVDDGDLCYDVENFSLELEYDVNAGDLNFYQNVLHQLNADGDFLCRN